MASTRPRCANMPGHRTEHRRLSSQLGNEATELNVRREPRLKICTSWAIIVNSASSPHSFLSKTLEVYRPVTFSPRPIVEHEGEEDLKDSRYKVTYPGSSGHKGGLERSNIYYMYTGQAPSPWGTGEAQGALLRPCEYCFGWSVDQTYILRSLLPSLDYCATIAIQRN